MSTGTVAELWRWPVTGMDGERLRAARFAPHGMAGDAVHEVLVDDAPVEVGGWSAAYPFNLDAGIDPEHPPYAVVTDPSGRHSWRWGDPRLARALAEALGREITLARDAVAPHPVLVSADPSAAVHVRLSLAEPPAASWAGRELRFAGGVRLAVVGPAGPHGGVESRVVAPGRVAIGEDFVLD